MRFGFYILKVVLRACFLAFSFCLAVVSTYAFDESLLFFDQEEIDEVKSPDLIDGEYYSDLLAFRLSVENSFNFLSSKNGYEIAVGSISSKRFMIQQRLKLNQAISDKVVLKLSFYEQEDYEIARSHLTAGLSYAVNDKLSFSFNTSLFSQKSDNDIGAAVSYNYTDENLLKLFLNLPDFSFNERNEGLDSNEKQSLNIGVLGSHKILDKTQVEYFILNNSKLKRELVNLNSTYEFFETRAGVRLQTKIKNSKLNLSLEGFSGEEGLYLNSGSRQVWSREGLRLLSQLLVSSFTFGVETNLRKWSLGQEKVFHRNFMPHFWYKKNFKKYVDYIDFGLESSFHKASGPLSLRKKEDKDDDINSRFNMRLGFMFSKKAFLNFLLSLDVDDGSWEGGGGQFQALF